MIQGWFLVAYPVELSACLTSPTILINKAKQKFNVLQSKVDFHIDQRLVYISLYQESKEQSHKTNFPNYSDSRKTSTT